MKNVQLQESEVKQIYASASDEVKRLLEDKYGKELFSAKITDRVKSIQDAFYIKGVDYLMFLVQCKFMGDTPDEIAYKEAKVLAEVLNEGWKPDWTNGNQVKYYVWLKDYKAGVGFSDSDCDRSYAASDVGSRLCFKSSELALYAGSQFRKIYNTLLAN